MGRATQKIPREGAKVQKGKVLVSTTRNKHLASMSLIGILSKRIYLNYKRLFLRLFLFPLFFKKSKHQAKKQISPVSSSDFHTCVESRLTSL